jgi:hypothetical protein
MFIDVYDILWVNQSLTIIQYHPAFLNEAPGLSQATNSCRLVEGTWLPGRIKIDGQRAVEIQNKAIKAGSVGVES